MALNVGSILQRLGVKNPILLTGKAQPQHLDYLDLLQDSWKGEISPDAVVEFQGRPVLYVIDASKLSRDPTTTHRELLQLRHKLACRGDANFMAVLSPGQLKIYTIGLSRQLQIVSSKSLSDSGTWAIIPSIALGKLTPQISRDEEKIHDLIFRLMEQAIQNLIALGFTPNNALSLTGRALFLRFLMDRKVVSEINLKQVCPGAESNEECLSDVENSIHSNLWLDETFNGDLLPLGDGHYDSFFGSIPSTKQQRVFQVPSMILKKAEPLGGASYQTRLSWDGIDFAHVPVGLLSQVYERHCHKYDPFAKKNSIHYTPRAIAEYMVNEVFSDVKDNHKLKVLDPAVGAGVFLVVCFRKLVVNWWKKKRKRPSRKRIREILYTQIKGFDINEPALRLAALSLYLTAIELDPNPLNLSKIKFEPLRDAVLFDSRLSEEKGQKGPVLGSLALRENDSHQHKYDIVIGNPPWTSIGEKKNLAKQFNLIIKHIALKRGLETDTISDLNPDGLPDLPFVWRAMEWAKEGGRIAFALHARLLFKSSPPGIKCRNALFSALKVTGILNGASLRKTKVWPDVKPPFCLFFAINSRPSLKSQFSFLSPELEKNLNNFGRLRIDYNAAQPVELERLLVSPTLLKTLFRGSSLDVELIKKIEEKRIPLSQYWTEQNLKSGQGYQRLPRGQNTKEPRFLVGLGDLTTSNAPPFYVDSEQLPRFTSEPVRRRGKEGSYKGPLLIVRQSPSTNRDDGRAVISLGDVAFNESFFGYSASRYSQGDHLIRYLFLLLHSKLFLYYALMTSAVFGVERDKIYKQDIDNFPIIPFEELQSEQLETIRRLTDHIIQSTDKNWSEVDSFVYALYGLNKYDQEVIGDTLAVSLPFTDSKRLAQREPTPAEIFQFAHRFRQELEPFFEITKKNLIVDVKDIEGENPWAFIELKGRQTEMEMHEIQKLFQLSNIMDLANQSGASRIVISSNTQNSLIGILRQYRYWTPTRARLWALDHLREGDLFSKTFMGENEKSD